MGHTINETCIGCGACLRVCPVNAISGVKKEKHLINPKLCINCGACGRVCPPEAITDSYEKRVNRLKKSLWQKPQIDAEKCFACENCIAACPADALAMKSETLPLTENFAVLIFPEKCVSCGWCVENCQFDAIVMEAPDEDN